MARGPDFVAGLVCERPRGLASWTLRHWLCWLSVSALCWGLIIWLAVALVRLVRAVGGF